MRRVIAWTLLLVLWLTAGAGAQLLGGGGLAQGGGERVAGQAVVAAAPLIPGTDGQIVVELSIVPRYHVQSAFAAKPNIPARLTVKSLPPGITAGAVLAQAGLEIPTPPALGTGTMSVYEGKAYFVVPLKVAADAPAGPAVITLSLVTQACNDSTCDPPRTATLQIQTRIGQAGEALASPDPRLALAQAKTLLPQPEVAPSAGTPTRATSPAATAAVTPPPGAGKAVGLMSTAQQLAAIAQRPYQPFNADEHRHSLPALLLFALLGGLILNIMPCVLPVIPLKALSFVQQAHGSRRMALAHALAFAAGVVALFVALAVVLRVFGLFYGQQFQSVAFLVVMVMFVVALALSMLGVWTIQPPRAVYAADEKLGHQSGLAGSFSSGLMATLLATPCSAPFLGPVLAWALVQPAVVTALMLAVVGVGMSLPYVVLALFPGALAKVPRAGRWSELLKQGLGIVMLGVAVYLVTLVPSTQLWPWVMAGAIVVALVCWGWGQIPTVLMPSLQIWEIRGACVFVGALLGAGIVWMALTLGVSTRAVSGGEGGAVMLADRTTDGATWLPFNVALLDQALKEGRPVLVDWTADWCINCRVLEATVLSRQELRAAVVAHNAVLLRADLSEDNPPATALNHKLGGEAIPVLAIFVPGRPAEPVVLRDSYSAGRVVEELKAAR